MLFCYVLVSGEQDVNFFLFDGRRKGSVLSKSKGDIKENLARTVHQCSKMLARGHAGTPSQTCEKSDFLFPVDCLGDICKCTQLSSTGGSVCTRALCVRSVVMSQFLNSYTDVNDEGTKFLLASF